MISDPGAGIAIAVQGVGKRYRRQAGQAAGKSLRDELMRMLRPSSWFAPRGGGEHVALADVSFEIPVGERVAIVGPNGAGKSTLLKLLCRITPPTVGRIGRRGSFAAILEVGTGFHPDLTGRENIYLNGSILGLTRERINQRFDDIVAFADVGAFIDEPVRHYSSGMYVRLAFSIAAHVEPDVLILDEVLAVGDAEFRQRCLERLRALTEHSTRTIILVSHDEPAIRAIATRSLLIDQGRLIADGPTDEILRRYAQLGHR